MTAILAVTVPFFALVVAGYVAAWRHVLPESAIPGLNAFVLYFALPCMLFRFGLNTPLAEALNPVVLGLYLGCALLMVFVTIAFSLDEVVGLKDAAFGALVTAFPNTGFMGVPLLAALFGGAIVGPMIATILIDLFITSSLCIALAESGGATGGARAAALRSLRGALSNPMPWAIAAGGALGAFGWRPAGPLDTTIRMLADAATPVALFTIGAVLWRGSQHAHTRTALKRYLPQALAKLLLHPALVFAVAIAARAAGAPLTNLQITAITLTAALPSAANVAMLAERFGADNGRIARIILASTALSFVSFTLLAWVFGAKP
ncbi:MAG: AEC family transporter [Ideonella sp.]|nr:AEC family transporter [Ideonella sp.]MCC7458400.1 AEC family transporter [Nitrospira sp.]